MPKKFPLWQKFLLEKIAHQPLTFWGNFVAASLAEADQTIRAKVELLGIEAR